MQDVSYLAFKILSHFLVSSLFLLQQSIKLGYNDNFSSNLRFCSVLLKVCRIIVCAEDALCFFFVFVQREVIRRKIAEKV